MRTVGRRSRPRPATSPRTVISPGSTQRSERRVVGEGVLHRGDVRRALPRTDGLSRGVAAGGAARTIDAGDQRTAGDERGGQPGSVGDGADRARSDQHQRTAGRRRRVGYRLPAARARRGRWRPRRPCRGSRPARRGTRTRSRADGRGDRPRRRAGRDRGARERCAGRSRGSVRMLRAGRRRRQRRWCSPRPSRSWRQRRQGRPREGRGGSDGSGGQRGSRQGSGAGGSRIDPGASRSVRPIRRAT